MDGLFVKVNERQFGPLSLQEIQQFVKEGHLSRHDLIWSDEQDAWVDVARFPRLSRLIDRLDGKEEAYNRHTFAFASGKGGVGKTVMTTSFGVALADAGNEVVVIDADFGGPDVHTSLGILDPTRTFFDYYTLQCESLNDLALETLVENLRIISGACGTLGLANPNFARRQHFIQELETLRADYILIDLGAGTSYDVVDFFLLVRSPILVMSPEPTAVYDAFGFLKICFFRGLTRRLRKHRAALRVITSSEIPEDTRMKYAMQDLMKDVGEVDPAAREKIEHFIEGFRPGIILNMVKEHDDLKQARSLQSAARELLSLELDVLGSIPHDPQVGQAVMHMQPVLLYDHACRAAREIQALIQTKVLAGDKQDAQ